MATFAFRPTVTHRTPWGGHEIQRVIRERLPADWARQVFTRRFTIPDLMALSVQHPALRPWLQQLVTPWIPLPMPLNHRGDPLPVLRALDDIHITVSARSVTGDAWQVWTDDLVLPAEVSRALFPEFAALGLRYY